VLSGLTSMCGGIDINCLRKAEASWWYTAWLIRVLQFAWASTKQAQTLGYLPGHYRQWAGWGG
jgi:hypothetical protein